MMATTDALRSFDIRRWQREGRLSEPTSFRWYWSRDGEVVASINVVSGGLAVWLTFRSRDFGTDEWTDRQCRIIVTRTPCHFGDERVWFSCPTWNCGRRAAILYLGPGGRVACRRCYRLAYECRREKPHYRAMRRGAKIRERLGDPDGYTLDEITRPKGMHWRTYQRLLDAHDAVEEVSLNTPFARRLQRPAGPAR